MTTLDPTQWYDLIRTSEGGYRVRPYRDRSAWVAAGTAGLVATYESRRGFYLWSEDGGVPYAAPARQGGGDEVAELLFAAHGATIGGNNGTAE